MSGKKANLEDFLYLFENYCDSEKIENFKIVYKDVGTKGAGFMGVITFINLKGTKNGEDISIPLIIKSAVQNPESRTSLDVRGAFLTEKYTYTEIFPTFRAFENFYNIKESLNSVPRCYISLDEEFKEVLVLDNLKAYGFKMHEKGRRLNVAHVAKIFEEYGKYHALSYAYKHKQPASFYKLAEPLKENLVTQTFKNMPDIVTKMVENTVNELERSEEFLLANQLKNYGEDLSKKILKDMSKIDEYSVIIHGDSWINNFLFKYENNDTLNPSDVRILDWQCSLYANPIFDLSYLFWSSSDTSCYEHTEELLNTYYKSLNKHLKVFELEAAKVLPFDIIKRFWYNEGMQMGCLMALFIFKNMLMDPEEVPDVTSQTDDGSNSMEEFLKDISQKDEYLKMCFDLVKYLSKVGFFK